VLDGFPRTVAQGDALGEALEPHGRELTSVVLIDVPDDVVAERISGRGRADDAPETVRERLHVYHDETEPLIEYYEQRACSAASTARAIRATSSAPARRAR
jgi:adenylate kinase